MASSSQVPPPASVPAPSADSGSESACLGLLVEDDPLNLMLIEQWALMAGMKPMTAQTGRDALQELTARAPRVVITDMHLPDMRADTLVAEIRRIEATLGRAPVPVVLLTGTAPEDLAPEFVAQCAHVLYKPVMYEQFAQVVAPYCKP